MEAKQYDTLLCSYKDTEEIKEEIKIYLETNVNVNMKIQKSMGCSKGGLSIRRNCIVIHAYFK